MTLANVYPGTEPWVLIEGWLDDGLCESDYIEAYLGPLDFQNHVPGPSCTAQVAVGSAFRRFVVDTPTSGDSTTAPWWTTGSDTRSYELDSRLIVPLNVWVVGNLFDLFPWPFSSTSLTFAKNSVSRATKIFNVGRVGVSYAAAPLRQRLVMNFTSAAATIGRNCSAVPGLMAAGPPLYLTQAINVYFVPTVTDASGTGRGLNCFPSGHEEVIYVSLAFHTPTTLAHELGHALGHQGTYQHPDGITEFDDRNLMRSTFTSLTTPGAWPNETTWLAARDEVTFGQAYRMNVHTESWLNQWRGALAPLRTGIVWTCPDYWWMSDPCPELSVGDP